MSIQAKFVLFTCVLLCLSSGAHAKGGEGIVFLKGTIQGASATEEMVSFSFTGQLSFSFFTAAQGDPDRKQIDLKFDVRGLPVRIPKFGTEIESTAYDALVVNFQNAVKHAAAASETGELVSVVLFRPALSYDINGVIEKVACTHAQVMPARIERQLRGASR